MRASPSFIAHTATHQQQVLWVYATLLQHTGSTLLHVGELELAWQHRAQLLVARRLFVLPVGLGRVKLCAQSVRLTLEHALPEPIDPHGCCST
jgi:hypothetical protein